MNVLVVNVSSAVVIGIVIAAMATIKNSKLKALVYSLPIPITVALIATGGVVNATNIIGLFLISLFLWQVWYLHENGLSIYLSDVTSAITYVVVGFVAIKVLTPSFIVICIIYSLCWFAFMFAYRDRVIHEKRSGSSKISPQTKGIIVTVLAYVLLSLKSFLSGIVVTFPFSGVFAVVEGRHMLETLAATFSRNSIAILAFFIAIHYMGEMNLLNKVIIGWVVYVAVLKLVSAVHKIKTTTK